MSFIEKLKDFMGVEDENFDDDGFQEPGENAGFQDDFGPVSPPSDGETVPDETKRKLTRREKRALRGKAREEEKAAGESPSDPPLLQIRKGAQTQVVLVKPALFDDASGIADHLLEKRAVVMNLESTDREVSRRLIDFLSGVAYTEGGAIKKIANSTYIITPCNIDLLSEDVLDEIENNGLYLS